MLFVPVFGDTLHQTLKKKTSAGEAAPLRLLTVNTFIDNWDLNVPKLPLLT